MMRANAGQDGVSSLKCYRGGLWPLRSREQRSVSRIIEAVASALARAAIANGDLVLVALSGGPDSVAMLHALISLQQRFGLKVAAAHLNHRLRGAESDRDECFVRDLCRRLAIELAVKRAENLQSGSPNLEERARELRYVFLNRTADRLDARYIALAHHADDQAETVLMRMLRGSGIAGLAAMAKVGPGRLFRPLLTVRRSEILAYLNAIGADYVTDSTNASAAILRNRVRNDLLPLLEREYAPALGHRLAEMASEMRAVADLIETAARHNCHERCAHGHGR
jgi:tRNA(Ile)-lysidine synthase